MPNAIKLPAMATVRPLRLAGISSQIQRGVIDVLKPFPMPLVFCQFEKFEGHS